MKINSLRESGFHTAQVVQHWKPGSIFLSKQGHLITVLLMVSTIVSLVSNRTKNLDGGHSDYTYVAEFYLAVAYRMKNQLTHVNLRHLWHWLDIWVSIKGKAYTTAVRSVGQRH